jgi:hypothetical protein
MFKKFISLLFQLLNMLFYVFLIVAFYFKKPKYKHNISLLNSIIQNIKMSETQKLRRFSQMLRILLGSFQRYFSSCIVLGNQFEYQPLFSETLARKIKRLEKKGYKIQVDILMLKKVFEMYSRGTQISLMIQGVRVV